MLIFFYFLTFKTSTILCRQKTRENFFQTKWISLLNFQATETNWSSIMCGESRLDKIKQCAFCVCVCSMCLMFKTDSWQSFDGSRKSEKLFSWKQKGSDASKHRISVNVYATRINSLVEELIDGRSEFLSWQHESFTNSIVSLWKNSSFWTIDKFFLSFSVFDLPFSFVVLRVHKALKLFAKFGKIQSFQSWSLKG